MPDVQKNQTQSRALVPAALAGAVAAERAAADLRRSLPALVHADGAALLAFPAELMTAEAMARLGGVGAPQLWLTGERAAGLKIRHKGRRAVRLRCPAWMTAEDIRAAADPTLDLATPLKGPFETVDAPEHPVEAAALKLMKLARLLPALLGVRIETGNPEDWARRHGLMSVAAGAIADYEASAAANLRIVARARLPLAAAANARIVAFRPEAGGLEHFAVVVGDPPRHAPVLARLHSECFTGDLLGSLKCDCGSQLKGALAAIGEAGGGVLLYLAQEGRGIGLIAKLKAYALQDQGFDTVDANLRLGFASDERIFAPAAKMLELLGFSSVRLLTNNPDKVAQLQAQGIAVVERVAHSFPANEHNDRYLATKRDRTGHIL